MRTRRRPLTLAIIAALAGLAVLAATPARATFPGPNGRIAFADYIGGQIYTVNPDGSALAQLTHTGSNQAAQWPSWSANGKRILFALTRTNSADDHSRIWVMRADGSHQHRVAADAKGFRDYTPKFTPDGDRIIFTRCRPNDGVCAIWGMRADGSHKRALTPYVQSTRNERVDFGPSVSPNGKRIAFTRFFGEGLLARVFVMRADGNHPHSVTPARLEGGAPDWAPSGRRIAFNSNAPRAGSSLFSMKPDGSDINRLTSDRFPHADALPSYAPRGNRIAFISDRNHPDICCNDLFAINSGGGGEHMIDIGLSGVGIVYPAWGPAPLLP